MAPPGENISHSEAGPSSKASARSFRPSYADTLRSSTLLGSSFLLRIHSGRLQASLRSLHHQQIPGKPQPAAHQVLNTSELLAMILAELPMSSARRVMTVSKRFWECLNPDAESHLLGMKEALGLRFSRSIAFLENSEKVDLHQHLLVHGLELKWPFNIPLDCASLRGRQTPVLKIRPFALASLTGCLETGVFAINLKLDLGDARKYKCLRGVGTFRLGHKLLYRFGNGAYHNWMDIKLLNVPLKVQVTLAVDFREAMGASGHPHGPCPVYGCQVGLYGVQYTQTTLELEHATVGEFFAFLDLVERDARAIYDHIFERTSGHGLGFFREAYYLGPPSVPPPVLRPVYERNNYVVETSSSHMDAEAIEQSTPRSVRAFAYPL